MRSIVSMLFMFLFGLSIFAQSKTPNTAWESKPFDQWDEADIKAILKDSPWSKGVDGYVTNSNEWGVTHNPGSASFRLQSALPIRLASLRKLQLAEKYDAMDDKHKEAFNKKYRNILECPRCEKFYIVAIGGANSPILQNGGSIERRAGSIYLTNEKGERRTLASFTPQTSQVSEALFYFPRNNAKGEPLLTPKNTTLTFNFITEDTDEIFLNIISRVEVKVQDIVIDGKVIF